MENHFFSDDNDNKVMKDDSKLELTGTYSNRDQFSENIQPSGFNHNITNVIHG